MSHFAEIDENGVVIRVIVAEQDVINSGICGDSKNWIETSYNTNQGIHKLGGTPLRKNYASVGFQYDKVLDAFITPKQYVSFILDEQKGIYTAPIEMPKDGKEYFWNEKELSWKESIS